jgi:hypothetical protein
MSRDFPLFDSVAFARRLRAGVDRRGVADACCAEEAGVDRATFARATNASGALSHENWLRLAAWLDRVEALRPAA